MKKSLLVVSMLGSFLMMRAQLQKVEDGVSWELAQKRKETISSVKYNLNFKIPKNKSEDILGSESTTFVYQKVADVPLQIDFKEKSTNIKSVFVNGISIDPKLENEHILIDPKHLKQGSNQIDIEFIAGNSALNRREDFLYTLFVPDRARTVFPCFDQPNLKATFQLSLTIPKEWKALANGKLKDSTSSTNDKTYHFAESDILPTYLFSFAAGNFKSYSAKIGSENAEIFYRETDEGKIKSSMDSIYSIYNSTLNFYEKWTGIKYPFQANGLVSVPDFQFGGMEHPGAILFQNATMFLDKDATQNQLNNRSNLIGHEVAHMWFGDLVTMDWFNDVWTKEVFANFMADKSTGATIDPQVKALKFLTTHFPAAYSVDRTLGANPIRQQLDNLKNAGMMYGPIIYNKAPIMMQQLELLMGAENFQKGIQEYLRTFSYKNATWPDLIGILDKYTPQDLQSWNKVWVNESGRPFIHYEVKYKGNSIKSFSISQKPEFDGSKKLWVQTFPVTLYYADREENIQLNLQKKNQKFPELKGKEKPLYIQLNSSGIGYGIFHTDADLIANFDKIKNPVSRASAYISVYENMLNSSGMTPEKALQFFVNRFSKEDTELNLNLISGYFSTIYWEFLNEDQRNALAPNLEATILQSMEGKTAKNQKKILWDTFQNVFLTKAGYDKVFDVWKNQKPPAGITLNDDDYTGLANALALRNNNNSEILSQQLARIKNPDKIARFKIVMQAVSSDKSTRDAFFNGLSDKGNRSNESAIGSALYYLHHPLRQETSIAYLPKSLELLQEIQTTGDIFFPNNWLRGVFVNYQDPKALQIVKDFIIANPQFNSILKNKILQATDNLRRAQTLVK